MLLFVATLISLTLVLLAPRLHLGGDLRAAPLGFVSERWLAEHRASQAA